MIETMKPNFILLLVALFCAKDVKALVVDFEDLTHGAQFAVGTKFTSNGVEFEIQEFGQSASGVLVTGVSLPVESTVIAIDNGNIVNVGLLSDVRYASVDFNTSCRGCHGLVAVVNGVTLPPINFANSLDGVSVPGITLALEGVQGARIGRLIMEGPLTSLGLAVPAESASFGGLIDNLTLSSIPEPTTWLLSICAVSLSTLLRQSVTNRHSR